MATGNGNAGGRFQYNSMRMICCIYFYFLFCAILVCIGETQIEYIRQDFKIK